MYYKEVIGESKNKMKTTWNIIRKGTSKLNNEGKINSIRINDQIVHNQITIANKLNSYFSNITGNRSNKRINENEGANPIQNLFKYFNQPFKDIRWPYISAKK